VPYHDQHFLNVSTVGQCTYSLLIAELVSIVLWRKTPEHTVRERFSTNAGHDILDLKAQPIVHKSRLLMEDSSQLRGQPPSYADDQQNPDEILKPMILLMESQFIYPESAQASPMYKLRLPVATLTDATDRVVLERLDYNARKLADGSPTIVTRPRHIYNLIRPGHLMKPPYRFMLESQSRRLTLGSVGLKDASFPHSGQRAFLMTTTSPKDTNFTGKAKDDVCFEVKEKDKRNKWSDAAGNTIAIEDVEAGLLRLLVIEPLTRRKLDALVGTWCLRVWEAAAAKSKQPKDWKEGMGLPLLPCLINANVLLQ